MGGLSNPFLWALISGGLFAVSDGFGARAKAHPILCPLVEASGPVRAGADGSFC